MTRYSRKKHNNGYTGKGKQIKMKNRKRDLDEIDVDIMDPNRAQSLLNQAVDLDLPGGAQFYCIHCARYFISNDAMTGHFRTKLHKRRMKALELEPYNHKEAEAAAGFGSYHAPKRRKIETQPVTVVDENKVVESIDMMSEIKL